MAISAIHKRILKLLAMGLLPSAFCMAQTSVDTVMVHGKVWTENSKQPEAEAVAIADGKIVAVGDSAKILKMAAPKTKVIELHGRRVVPASTMHTSTSSTAA